MSVQLSYSPARWLAHDLDLCIWLNQACRHKNLRQLFVTVSWLGDGKLWYTLMLLLPVLYGDKGLSASLKMVAVGAAGLIIYKLVKSCTHRLRPFMAHQAINLGTPPLDKYSFPSGHTLHATSFSIITISAFPVFGWFLLPALLLIALSRVILGLHYPSDVGFGALIGATLAIVSLPY